MYMISYNYYNDHNIYYIHYIIIYSFAWGLVGGEKGDGGNGMGDGGQYPVTALSNKKQINWETSGVGWNNYWLRSA